MKPARNQKPQMQTVQPSVLANVSHLVSSLLWVAVVTTQASACCCVSIQGLHRSEEHLKANYVTTLCKGSSKCTAAVLRGLTYPKILCATIKEERKREDGDIAWRRSSLSWAWAAEILM